MYPLPVHYDTGNGWEDVTFNPVLEDGVFVVHAGSYTLSTLRDAVGVRMEADGRWVEVRCGDAPNMLPVVDQGRIRWNGVYDDLDVYVDARTDGFEFFKVVHSAAAPHELEWEVSYDHFDSESFFRNYHTEMRGWDDDGNTLVCGRDITELDDKFILHEWWKPVVRMIFPGSRQPYKMDAKYPLLVDVPEISVTAGLPSQEQYNVVSGSTPSPSMPWSWPDWDTIGHAIQSTSLRASWAQYLYTFFSTYYFRSQRRFRLMFHNSGLPQGARIQSATLTLPVVRARGRGSSWFGAAQTYDDAPAEFDLVVIGEPTPSRIRYDAVDQISNDIAEAGDEQAARFRKDLTILTGWFSDDFVEVLSNYAIENHDPEQDVAGTGWEERWGQVEVDGGEARIQGAATPTGALAVADASVSTGVSVETTMFFDSCPVADDQGIVFRYVDDNNYLLLSPDIGTGWKLQKVVGGTPTVLDTAAVNVPPATGQATPKVLMEGNSIQIYTDLVMEYGSPDIEYELDSGEYALFNNSQTKIGLLFSDNQTGVDEFKFAYVKVYRSGETEVDVTQVVQALVDEGEGWKTGQAISLALSSLPVVDDPLPSWNGYLAGGSQQLNTTGGLATLDIDYEGLDRSFDYEAEIVADNPVQWVNFSSASELPTLSEKPDVDALDIEFWFDEQGNDVDTPSSGGTMYRWPQVGDSGPTDKYFYQFTSSYRPYWYKDANFNGRGHLWFDGSNDYMYGVGPWNSDSLKSATVVAVANFENASETAGGMFTLDNGTDVSFQINSNAYEVHNSGTVTGGTTDTDRHVFRVVYDETGNEKVYVDEVLVADGAAGAEIVDRWGYGWLGRSTDGRGNIRIAYYAIAYGVTDITTDPNWSDWLDWAENYYATATAPAIYVYDRVSNFPWTVTDGSVLRNDSTRAIGEADPVSGAEFSEAARVQVDYSDWTHATDDNCLTPAYELSLTQEYTVEMWFKTDTLYSGQDTRLFRYGWYGVELGLTQTNGYLYGGHSDSGGGEEHAEYAVDFTDGQWHHVAVTFDGVTVSLYADRVLVDTHTAGDPPHFPLTDTADATVIGWNGPFSGGGFTGSIEDVVIYDYALDVGRIQAHYDAARERQVAYGELGTAGFLSSEVE